MTLLLGVVIFGVLLSLLYGWMLEFVAVKLLKLRDDHDLHFSITILLGMTFLSGLLGIWSFYRGIGTRAVVVFSVLALLALIGIWKYAFVRLKVFIQQLKSLSVLSWLLFTAVSIYVLYTAASAYSHYDTGLYQAQAIHWIEDYRVVPGLANLHVRLGFNSSIFLLASFWGFVGFGWHLYQVSGLIVFLCFILYSLYLMERLRKDLTLSGIMTLGLLVCFFFINVMSWLASPTTDLPSALISWIVFLLAIEKIRANQNEQLDVSLISIVILSLFAITIKLSSLPILLIPIFFLWKARTFVSVKKILASVLLSSLVFLPWLVRNIVLTGYLIFPFAQLDIFALDWKVPPEMVRQLAVIITSWARIPSQDPNLVFSMPLGQWFPIWYKALPISDLVLLVGILIGIILLIVLIAINKEIAGQFQIYASVYIVGLIGVVFWFIQAPSPRFGYGFIVPLFLLLYIPVIFLLFRSLKFSPSLLVSTIESLLVLFLIIFLIQIPLKSWTHYVDSVKPYPQIDTKSFVLGNQTFFIPAAGDQCWYDAFPCAPSEIPGLALRGSNLQDGFYISKK